MKDRKALLEDLKTVGNLKDLIGAYEEIAAMRMRKVKKSVLVNREFFQGLNEIYRRVMFTYKLAKSKGPKKLGQGWLQLDTNGKTVSVLISSNTGLYGDVIKDTYKLFKENTAGMATDLAIIGKIGKQLYEFDSLKLGTKRSYKYYEMSDNGVDIEKIKEISDELLFYTNIIVYHGLYVSILSQKPVTTFVTGKALDISAIQSERELKCIIEPTVEEVTKFFERQILASIFEQSVYEASLSKFASRMMSLDYAVENITSFMKKINYAQIKLKHNKDSLVQLERLSSLQV